MDFGSNIALGFTTALQPLNLAIVAFGVTLGTLAGVLPGVGAITAISILLPLTFYMDPTSALIMLAGIYYGAQYGGSTTSILMNIPGTSTHAVTCLDGYPLAKQGRAGPAMFIAGVTSFVGGSFAILLMMFLAPPIAEIALKFQSAEYVNVMLFGLVSASTLSAGSPLKGLAMVTFGLVLGVVGMDLTSGVYRFNFGFLELSDGLNLVAVAMGLFGVAEILMNLMKGASAPFTIQSVKLKDLLPTWSDIRLSILPTARASVIGAVCGILPGVGPTIASFMGYAAEKRVAKRPERFGRGAMEGIAAPEAANNAAAQAGFIPTLSLGLPGDAIGAVLLGALLLHGIAPGPSIVTEQAGLFWGLIGSFWIGNVLLLILNIPFDRGLGQRPAHPLQRAVPRDAVLHLHRRVQHQLQCVRHLHRRDLRHRRDRDAGPRVSGGAAAAGLHPRSADRGEPAPRDARVARRSGDPDRKPDQRGLRHRDGAGPAAFAQVDRQGGHRPFKARRVATGVQPLSVPGPLTGSRCRPARSFRTTSASLPRASSGCLPDRCRP
jgi:putative tricarboxylic transport membrane protein